MVNTKGGVIVDHHDIRPRSDDDGILVFRSSRIWTDQYCSSSLCNKNSWLVVQYIDDL